MATEKRTLRQMATERRLTMAQRDEQDFLMIEENAPEWQRKWENNYVAEEKRQSDIRHSFGFDAKTIQALLDVTSTVRDVGQFRNYLRESLPAEAREQLWLKEMTEDRYTLVIDCGDSIVDMHIYGLAADHDGISVSTKIEDYGNHRVKFPSMDKVNAFALALIAVAANYPDSALGFSGYPVSDPNWYSRIERDATSPLGEVAKAAQTAEPVLRQPATIAEEIEAQDAAMWHGDPDAGIPNEGKVMIGGVTVGDPEP